MPTFNDPVADAEELREAVRSLAHATRVIDDPTTVYPALGSISSALASLNQSLHQLGAFHDAPATAQASIDGDAQAGRAASYRVAWELHRAAEMIRQVAECVAHAHQIEATIAYQVPDVPDVPAPVARTARTARAARDVGLSL